MNRTTKCALAAGAAATLLLGAAGMLAYWSDEETIDGTDVNDGSLALVIDCVNTGCGAWELDTGELDTGEAAPTTYVDGDRLVPGDVLTKVCAYTIQAEGDHLRATVGVSTPTLTAGTGSFGSDVVADVSNPTVDGLSATSFTDDDDDDGDALVATISVTFDPASTNSTQDASAVLEDLTLSANRVHS